MITKTFYLCSTEQNRIVKEIQSAIDTQNIYTQQIQEQRNKIDSLIESAVGNII